MSEAPKSPAGCRLIVLQARAVRTCRTARFAPPRARWHACGCREVWTRRSEPPSAPQSMTDGVVPAQQPQSRGVVSTFEPHARALTMRSFGAISAVPFGKVRGRRRVPLSGRVMPLQLLSATCSTSMVVLRSTCCLVGWWAPHSERGNFSHPRRLVRRDLLVASRRRGTRRIAFLALSCRPVCIACGHRRKSVQTSSNNLWAE